MFSLSKGEPPTPPTTATSPPSAEIPVPPRTRSAPMAVQSTSTDQPQQTGIGAPTRDIPQIRTQSTPRETDSGFEASPSGFNDPGSFFGDDNDVDFDEVFCNEANDDRESEVFDRDDWCPNCDDISSCSCSRAGSSLTVRPAAMTDPNTCDSDASNRSSPQSPPPSSWPTQASCSNIHNNRLPCPRCNGGESSGDHPAPRPCLLNIMSRSFPGTYSATFWRWWARPTGTTPTENSNRSDDRRSTRSRRRQIDSDASSSSSCDENSADEVFSTPCEDPCLEDLGTMTEAEELRVTSPEQLPDLVQLPSDPSRRVRSQSVSTPQEVCIREIGTSLRRLSNEFENRFAERHTQQRRASLTSFLNW